MAQKRYGVSLESISVFFCLPVRLFKKKKVLSSIDGRPEKLKNQNLKMFVLFIKTGY